MDWENRENVASQKDATEVLADFISSTQGIGFTLKNQLDDAEEFAHKWDIPFDRNFIVKMVTMMNNKRWNGDTQLIPDEDIIDYYVFRSDYDSDEKFEEEVQYYRDKMSHYWMTSSETSLCD